MSVSRFLAFDLGAESGRAMLGTLEAGKLVLQERHRFANPTGRLRGHLHWNLLGQWEELKTGLRKGAADATLDGIGVDTWGVDFGLLDDAGDLLGDPYHYRDSRTEGMMDHAFARFGKRQLFQTTGIQFLPFNSLYQLLAMRQQRPRVLERAAAMLFMPDLFNYLFTGVQRSESSIASTSQMIDPRTGQWATAMLDQLDLPTRILPQLVPAGTILGPVCEEVARECGVSPVPLIAPGCHDTASAVAAVPAEGADWCYISSGTWSLMGVELDRPLINDTSLKYNYTNEGGVGGKIRFLKNIMGLWLVQECRRWWQKEGHEHGYAALTEMAQQAKPFAAMIDPDDAPFLSPGEMPRKIDQFCLRTRQPAPATRGEVVRSCLEGLALVYRRTLGELEEMLGRKLTTIHIVGGGGQNELLNQMTADACARPVVAGPVEATAIGNLLVQAMATGHVSSLAEARRIVRQSFPTRRYEPRDIGVWDKAQARFREIGNPK